MTSELEHCLAILKALQIAEVSYCLSGGGDSGTVEINHVLYADGRHGPLGAGRRGLRNLLARSGRGSEYRGLAAPRPGH